ncbi:uncharacterized protein LOC103706379 isoform X1 [Phoenix dactylifera]|uniref:Uncharacterized protein LOC103706379 isoform X1 n=1 Tax=Phoenix dactylifera TaxID=42345 RepID=A0A8B8J421_PHODC|nr:uncharacterized protein LOC103706379 isoform X1 [Phoenix dactylifera]
MGFFRRMAGFLGIGRDDGNEPDGGGGGEVEEEDRMGKRLPRGRAKGFSVQVPHVVERSSVGPVLIPCSPGEGGVQATVNLLTVVVSPIGLEEKRQSKGNQGFRWYTRKLRIDEDGDVADEFLDEIGPEAHSINTQMTLPRFQVKYNTRSTAMAMRKQVMAVDGNIKQRLEYQGKLRWV